MCNVHPLSQKRLQKFRAKRIEIGQGIFTSCNRRLKFSVLPGAIQDLAIHGQMCIQSFYRHKQCFHWILGTGTNVCIVDKDLIFPPQSECGKHPVAVIGIAMFCRSRKMTVRLSVSKRKEKPPTQKTVNVLLAVAYQMR